MTALDTVPDAPPCAHDTEPDPQPPETGSMPAAPPATALVLADSHGWRRPLPSPPPPPSPRIEKAVVAPPPVFAAPKSKRRGRLAVSWRAVGAFSLGSTVTVLTGVLLDRGLDRVVAFASVLVVALWFALCIERR